MSTTGTKTKELKRYEVIVTRTITRQMKGTSAQDVKRQLEEEAEGYGIPRKEWHIVETKEIK